LALPDLRSWPELLAQFNTFQDAITFFRPKIAPFLLICTTIFWYHRYKSAVINELNQINEAFEEDRSPRYFGNIEGHKLIPYVGYMLVLTFIALVLVAPYIW